MKFKKLLAPLMAVSLIASAMPVANVSAASNEPQLYVDITYEDDGDIRGDVIMKNMPTLYAGGFHIEFGDSWTEGKNNKGLNFTFANTTPHEIGGNCKYQANGEHGGFFTFNSPDYGNYDYNGRICSFYLKKTKSFDPDNAEINIAYYSTENASDFLYHLESNHSLTDYSPIAHEKSPVMLGAYEYKVGDVNNDGYVDVIDSSLIRSALKDNNNSAFIVDSIKHTYKRYFPEAVCPASPDATQDGTIGQLDADLIMDYYVDMSTDGVNNSRIGKLDFYELFDD